MSYDADNDFGHETASEESLFLLDSYKTSAEISSLFSEPANEDDEAF